MTQNPYYQSDAPASEHEQARPTHAHSDMPPDEGVWAAARASYVAGCSTPVVAERHGLNERTVRRRAATEDWPALRRARAPGATLWNTTLGFSPAYSGELPTRDEARANNPEAAPFLDAHAFEVGELLLRPEPERLARFAFRRSAEAAAQGAAAEAVSWMRLVAAVERSSAELDRVLRPIRPVDDLRVSYAEAVHRYWEERRVDEGGLYDEEDEETGANVGEVSGCPDVR